MSMNWDAIVDAYIRIYFSTFPLSRQRMQGPMQNFALPMQTLHERNPKESFRYKESPLMRGDHIKWLKWHLQFFALGSITRVSNTGLDLKRLLHGNRTEDTRF